MKDKFVAMRIAHGYAQTNLQLYNQLLSAEYRGEDVRRVRAAYTFATVLFSGRFQPSGKTFISHVVGTASILGSLGASTELICAGLLHNAYGNGEFGFGKSGFSSRKQRDLQKHVSIEVEKYISAFTRLPWKAEGLHALYDRFEDIDSFARGALLLRVADTLEHLLDGETNYYSRVSSSYYLEITATYIRICEKLGMPALAQELHKLQEQNVLGTIPTSNCCELSKHASYAILPRSYRKKLCIPTVLRAIDRLQELRAFGINRLKRLCWKSGRLFKNSCRAIRRRLLGWPHGFLEIKSKEFSSLFPVGARLQRIATGFRFAEGPVWIDEDQSLLFSDIPANRIVKIDRHGKITTFRHPSGNSNGIARDLQGRLIVCEHGNRRVTRTEIDGTITVLADQFAGKRLNSPNDVVVKSDGSIYFTDPPYGIKAIEREQSHNAVYRIWPDSGEILITVEDMKRPNGLAFSSDESRLYIDDSQLRQIRVFDVDEQGKLSNGRLFHDMNVSEPGSVDGMKVDVAGRVYCTGPGGVWVFDKEGNHMGTILAPEQPSNCAWGDDDLRSLFVTARTSIYKIRVCVPGIQGSRPSFHQDDA